MGAGRNDQQYAVSGKGSRMAKGFRVELQDDEYEFIKKLAKYDGITVRQEVQALLSLQIREEVELEEEQHLFT